VQAKNIRWYQGTFRLAASSLRNLSRQTDSGNPGESPLTNSLQGCKSKLRARPVYTDYQLCRFRERVAVPDDFSDAPSEFITQNRVAEAFWN